MNSLEEVVAKRLISAVGKEIDLETVAKELAPAVRKAIKKAVLESFKRLDLTDYIYDAIDKPVYKALSQLLIKGLKSNGRIV